MRRHADGISYKKIDPAKMVGAINGSSSATIFGEAELKYRPKGAFEAMWINGILLTAAILLTVLAVSVFVYATRTGQFEDVEEAKFTMLRSEEDDPHTERRW